MLQIIKNFFSNKKEGVKKKSKGNKVKVYDAAEQIREMAKLGGKLVL
jgi:hypothetical protein